MTWWRLRRARATPWTPYMIPSSLMYGWLDAEKAETITQATGLVSSWVDTVTGTAFVQATDASKPGYSATGFNGRPCLTFDGTADNLAYTAGAIAWPNSGPFEVWALVDQQEAAALNTTKQIMAWPNTNINGLALPRIRGAGSRSFFESQIGTGAATVGARNENVEFQGLSLARLRYDGANAVSYMNGTPSAPVAVTASFSGATRYRIGSAAGAAASQFWNGSINFLMVTRLLDDQWAIPLQAYLNARRGA